MCKKCSADATKSCPDSLHFFSAHIVTQSSSSKHGDHQQDYEENEVLFDSEALELSEFSDKSDDDQQMYRSDDNGARLY